MRAAGLADVATCPSASSVRPAALDHRRGRATASVILLDEPGAGLSSADAELLLLVSAGPDLAVMYIDSDIKLAFRLTTQVTALRLGEIDA